MIAVFLIYWGIPHKFRWVLLLIANGFFYTCFDVKYLFVLLFIIIVSYFAGIYIQNGGVLNNSKAGSDNNKGENKSNGGNKNKNKGILNGSFLFVLSVLLIVAPLLVFKYLNFTIYSVQKVLSLISIPVDSYTLKLMMPIGISFYTFEAISYIADIKAGKIGAERNFLKYALFISFFPNITSGPIERAGSFIPQIDREKEFDYEKAVYGLRLLLLGMLKKYVCADIMVKYINNVFDHVISFSGTVFLIAIFMYTFQIYFDFSGYTDMARAVAMLLGFDLRENFRCPYFATSIKDFWGRWHISLSTWLRDYIYIPLGGNRKGRLRKNINLLITFFVSGLWHGASFTFIVWGMIHGVVQVIEGFIYKDDKRNSKRGVLNNEKNMETKAIGTKNKMAAVKYYGVYGIRILVTFCIVAFAWMFFRTNSLAECVYIIKNMFSGGSILGAFQSMGMTKFSIVKVMLSILLVMILDYISLKRDILAEMSKWPVLLRWALYVCTSVLVIVVMVHEGTNASFIYFSF